MRDGEGFGFLQSRKSCNQLAVATLFVTSKQLVNSAPFVISTGPFLTSALADYGADNFTDKPKLRFKG